MRPAILDNFRAHPIGALIPTIVVAALVVMEHAGRHERERSALAASCAYLLIAMLAGAAFALYPTLLPSSADPARALTVQGAASGSYAMTAAPRLGGSSASCWWQWTFRYLYRQFRGKLDGRCLRTRHALISFRTCGA